MWRVLARLSSEASRRPIGSSPSKACPRPPRIPFRRRGLRSTCRSADTASPARSWQRPRSSRRSQSPQTRTSTTRCPISAGAGRTSGSERPCTWRPAGRGRDMKTSRTGALRLTRRDFIVGTAVAGGLAVGMRLPLGIEIAEAKNGTNGGTEINAWVVVKPDDTCVIRIARSEMGQGTLTGLAQLVAEELECDWKKVATDSITPGQNLARQRIWGEMGTGGSRGIRTSQDYVRRGGAVARQMLLQAAANQWSVPVTELSVAEGVITHAPSRRRITYGKVASAAAKLTPPDPKSITLKDPKDWKIAGKPMKRLDTASKLDGSKVYAIDLRLPGMLHAAVKACPVFGGKLVSFDQRRS